MHPSSVFRKLAIFSNQSCFTLARTKLREPQLIIHNISAQKASCTEVYTSVDASQALPAFGGALTWRCSSTQTMKQPKIQDKEKSRQSSHPCFVSCAVSLFNMYSTNQPDCKTPIMLKYTSAKSRQQTRTAIIRKIERPIVGCLSWLQQLQKSLLAVTKLNWTRITYLGTW